MDVDVGVGVIDSVESAGLGLEEVDRHRGCWGLGAFAITDRS